MRRLQAMAPDTPPETVHRTIRTARAQLSGCAPGAVPELLERLCVYRLTTLADRP